MSITRAEPPSSLEDPGGIKTRKVVSAGLRRSRPGGYPPLTDEELVANAAAVFSRLDAEEDEDLRRRRPRGKARAPRHSTSEAPEEIEPLTPAQTRELRRQIKDIEDRTRYVLVSVLAPTFVLYYNVSDDAYGFRDPGHATVFKRRAAAEAVRARLGEGVQIVRCRVDSRGRVVRRSIPRLRADRFPRTGGARRAAERELRLRVVVVDPPRGVSWKLQSSRPELLPPARSSARQISFELTARLGAPLPDGRPRFLGECMQGPPQARFVYVCSGTLAGQIDSPWSRRAKVSLATIRAPDVESALATPGAILEARFAGVGEDGCPACGTVPLLAPGWRVARAGARPRR